VIRLPVSEADLHAYVDGILPAERAAEIEAYLAEHPEDAARVSSYCEQTAALHRAFDPMLDEPLPRRLEVPRPVWRRAVLRYAAVVAWIALGGVAGWHLNAYHAASEYEATTWARRAVIAHVVYSPEVRHPVEVGASEEAHLVRWLSKRLGASVKAPHLGDLGYSLVGGRLLPGDRGPVAQFMYQDAKGQRLTLYVRRDADKRGETAFRFSRERGVGVFYWIDGGLGYALSGEIDKPELLRVATAVYRQFNP
jgi:anti-sigma factor RsiW